jgi:hypothetical protein
MENAMGHRWHYPEEETPLSDESFLPEYPVVQLPQPVAAFLRLKNIEERAAYLHSRTALRWCFLTAHDPDGQQLDNEENEDRNCQVIDYVKSNGCDAITREDPRCPAWLPLGGILIIGISQSQATQLGLFDLGQSAIIVGKLGEPGTILFRLPKEEPSQ